MYQVWSLVRKVLFGRLCRDAALGNGGKGKMLRAMTLKFEKSYEVKVGIHDIPVFVKKYLCQEKKFGIRLGQWRQLPERWTGMVLGAGFVEAMAAAVIRVASLWFEAESLWEQAQVCLLDYVANTLYPRQVHVYEGFGEPVPAEEEETKTVPGRQETKKGVVLAKEEEQLFQEVLSDFLGSST